MRTHARKSGVAPGYDPAEGEDRYYVDRERHIKLPTWGGTSPEVDRESAAFEAFVAYTLGIPRDQWPTHDAPRDGPPLSVVREGQQVTVKPYHIYAESGEYLILSPGQERNPADVYVCGKGRQDRGFRILGWATKADLAGAERRQFGARRVEAEPAIHKRDLRAWADFMAGVGAWF